MKTCSDILKNASNLPDCYDDDGTEYKNCLTCPYHFSNIVFLKINESRRNENKICKEIITTHIFRKEANIKHGKI